MWKVILISAILVSVLCLIYLASRLRKFSFFQGLDKKPALLLSLFFTALVMAGLYLNLDMMNYFICISFAIVFWLLCDLIGWLYHKLRRDTPTEEKPRRYIAGLVALILTVSYLAYAWYNAATVVATHYDVPSQKVTENFRVIQITDSHIGTLFDASKFSEYVAEINTCQPDIVVVTGDFVDDTTTREDMLASCDALGRFRTKYGVYFVYGNHDRAYFSESSKSWANEELEQALAQNNVHVLLDDHINITDEICLIGRIDATEGSRKDGRKNVAALVSESGRGSRFTIVLDHEPREYAEEASAGVDLVLSGHTHGGQLFPINNVCLVGGLNDMVYGMEKRDNTYFEVSSGIGDWAVKFRTGCPSEYVVLDIQPE